MSAKFTDPIGAPERTTEHEAERLVGKLKRRDPAAMGRLYDLMGRCAHGLAYRILQDDRDAEDAVQDAFLTLWQQADRLDPGRGRVVGLLLTIVHRRSIDVLRARQSRSVRNQPFDAAAEPVDPTDVEAVALAAFDRRVLQEGLAQVPQNQREVLDLAYFAGLSHREIAGRLGLPVGTVKSRIRLGLEKLRGQIAIGPSDGL